MQKFFRYLTLLGVFVWTLSGISGAVLAADAKGQKAKAPTKNEVATPAIAEIEFSHQLSTSNAERLAALVDRFNREQTDMAVRLVRAQAHGKPALLSLATPDTVAGFIANKSSFKPLYRLAAETKENWPLSDFSADLWVGTNRAKPTALPVAFSTPVLFYNKRIFRQAGIDPDQPPKTWQEMQEISNKLLDHNIFCPYTSSWPTWIHIDNVSAVANVSTLDKQGKLNFNALEQVRHIAMLATWYKSGFFQTFGRANEADEHFYSGECAMLTTDSWAHSFFREAPGVELGIAPLPRHEESYTDNGHTLASGASIWIGNGYKAPQYKLAARFLRFVMMPETQLELVKIGGFLPLTDRARQLVREQIQKDEEDMLDLAYKSLGKKGADQPLRVSTLEPVRIIVDEELEQVWAGKKPAKAALDTAVKRGNAVLSTKPALKKALSLQ